MTAPLLTSDKVTLRPHRQSDFDAYCAFFRSPRAQYMDVPADASNAWYGFASEVGSWDLVGQGGWAIETPDGALAGQIAVTQPPHFPERELGWFLLDGFEGRGLAYAAGVLARDWAFAQPNTATLVSYIHRDNTRSIRLAERLGATLDPAAVIFDAGDVVYRYHEEAAA
ncbi:GNAT family N-acetyltransferase [Pseudooceanicola sp. 502str34]|uniref:GNAT family N-acetyltransferase n=1 Tax=Maritimibacter alkaliphilus TaxID=404236 RepID=UPI001C955DEF|nr:GNAT family N-acetyltransferase [Maritimibacter alkaliphilus]MBY6088893.1 GNAT family N-acetyltransferase [Maritimibacter alkaliphilus]